MFFRDIPGQQESKQRLIRSVHEERISHAQLFHGPEGCGKLALAVAFARFISCTNRGEEESCGTCPSCLKFNKLAHPDLHFSFPGPAKESDAGVEDLLGAWRAALLENPFLDQFSWYEKIGLENKQGIIGVRQSDEIIRKLGLKSYESDYKILIIWLPERMNLPSANSLLKTIEEPSKNTVILMVSESVDDILPTIRSRTQIYRVPKIGDEDMRRALEEKTGSTGQVIEDAVKLSNGNLNQALASIRSDEQNKACFERFVSLMRLAYAKDVEKLVTWVDQISGLGREKQKLFLLYALRMIRENFMVNMKRNDVTHMSGYEYDFSSKFSRFVKPENVPFIYAELNEAHNHISANGYARIIFLDMSLKMIRYLHM